MKKRPKPQLREGFTTGSAAAAAASGALAILLGEGLPSTVAVACPPFMLENSRLRPCGDASLSIPLADGASLPCGKIAWAEVIKDGGDDPDATHGVRIRAYASLRPFSPSLLPESALAPSSSTENNGLAPPLIIPCDPCVVCLYGGRGVGLVTLPGLPAAPGEPAINPEPRKQIAYSACKTAMDNGHCGQTHILICVEDGVERARRTLNPRLGIVGGISILGTRGTVKPYSSEAWKETIIQGLNVAQHMGLQELLLCTGRRSERLGFGLFPSLPPQAGVQAADFAAFALREAARRPFARLRWICFPGKLLKLAQGLEWTHAKEAAADISMLARLCREAGAKPDLVRSIEAMPTASGAFDLMREKDRGVRDAALGKLALKAFSVMEKWVEEAGREHGELILSLHVFSQNEELLLSL